MKMPQFQKNKYPKGQHTDEQMKWTTKERLYFGSTHYHSHHQCKDNRSGETNVGNIAYKVEEGDDSERGGEGEGGSDSVGADEADGEADGGVAHDRRDHQAQEHLDWRVSVTDGEILQSQVLIKYVQFV